MTREAISEATTKKMPTRRRLPLPRWRRRTHRLMSNRKQILREECAGEQMLKWPVLPPPLLPLPRATFLSGFSELSASRHRLHRHRPVGSSAQQHDEPSVRIAPTASIGSSADLEELTTRNLGIGTGAGSLHRLVRCMPMNDSESHPTTSLHAGYRFFGSCVHKCLQQWLGCPVISSRTYPSLDVL